MLGILLNSLLFSILFAFSFLSLLLTYHKVIVFIVACQNWIVLIDFYILLFSIEKKLFKVLLVYNEFIF